MFTSLIYWAITILTWYLPLLTLSIIGLPLGSIIFQKFKDKGYPMYRALSLGVCGYIFFIVSRFHLLPLSPIPIALIFGAYLLLNIFLKKYARVHFPSIKTIISYELLFLAALFFWAHVKGHEPSLRSLEKYMDFGFINSILNSKYLPPQDMWYASTKQHFFPINYYYFGHFLTALLIRFTGIIPSIGYNLMLVTIFAFGITMSFSLGYNLFLFVGDKKREIFPYIAGILSAIVLNLGGNLHTIYLFTKGYNPDNPVPFWTILSGFNPEKYWYPNATRFIPYTIHEFPSYSYVVSDLHGHVLAIPFALLLFALFITIVVNEDLRSRILTTIAIALTLAVSYMTNSTDLLVYGSLLFILVIKYERLRTVLLNYFLILIGALILIIPFSLSFTPFAKSIGINCAPDVLVKLGHLGPLLFENDKCQTSPFWMLFVLWGFFWLHFITFLATLFLKRNKTTELKNKIIYLIFFIFVDAILLTLFAEFFYFKDIYPAHFRANTMFKLGYQSFMMMSVLSAVVATYILSLRNKKVVKIFFSLFFIPALVLVLLYPLLSVPSYFGSKNFSTLDGSYWIKDDYPEVSEIITLLNNRKRPGDSYAIAEAHGDSYTEYNIVSAQTGLPTIIGWPVHEWLWRGSYEVVGPRSQEVKKLYETKSSQTALKILKKYTIRYIVVSKFERDKYPLLNLQKFYTIGRVIYHKKNTFLFQINGI